MSPAKNAQHLVVRFSDSLYKGIDTIREHKLVIENKGAVWFAKVGRPLAKRKIEILNGQISKNIRTYLFLVQNKETSYIWTQAILENVATELAKNDTTLIPSYYKRHNIDGQSSIWFKVSRLYSATKSDIQRCYVVSSRRPISQTLNSSMAAMFMIYLGDMDSQKKSDRYQVSFEEALLDVYEDEFDDY
jgi:hypothetical protein